ncbi:MAG: flagellar M-ring protein FliF, partial [Rhizobiales bacterium]|nr:flagellar M-ring protein FliF [Hyphomicrobiales bacterium]
QLLANGEGDEVGGVMLSALEERKQHEEKRLRKAIEDIVFQVVGDGRARIQVSAELERNRVTQTSDIYDPNGQVIRSTQSRSETTNSNERLPDVGVTAGNELPGANAAGGDSQSNSAKETTDETINYEISRTTTTEVTEAGKITRLSVAVVVDGVYTENADGVLTYAPRDEEQLQQISRLVRSAIGFQEQRGDVVEVINMRFVASSNANAEPIAAPSMFNFTTPDIMYVAELGVILLVSLILILFVMRPLVRRVLSPDQQLVKAIAVAEAAVVAAETAAEGGPANERLEAAQADGAAKADMIRQVSEMVESNPDEAASILRNWMQEAA